MGRSCTTCQHEERSAIDAELVAGTSFRDIARRHGLSSAAVHRHRQHVPERLAQAQHAATVTAGDDLLAKVTGLETDARRIAAAAEASGDLKTALTGVRELTRIVELLAELRGELNSGAQVNVLVAPDWIATRTRILRALGPFPDARAAVARALEAGDP